MVQILPLPRKLLWAHIKEMYQNEWVELIDCDWEGDSLRPRRAIVRNHASDRAQLLSEVQKAKPDNRSIVLYVGMSHSVVSFDAPDVAA